MNTYQFNRANEEYMDMFGIDMELDRHTRERVMMCETEDELDDLEEQQVISLGERDCLQYALRAC